MWQPSTFVPDTDTAPSSGSGWQPSTFVPDEKTASDASPGYATRVGRIAGQAVSDIGEQETKPFVADNSAGPEWLQRTGDIGSRAANILVDMGQAGLSTLQGGVESGANAVIPFAAKAMEPYLPAGYKASNITPEKREQLSQDIGQVGTQALMAAPGAIGEMGEAASTAKQGLEGLADQYAAKYPAVALPEELPAPIPDKYFTSDTQQALSQSHALGAQHINDLYDWRDQMAAGKTAIVPDLKNTIDSAIEDAKSRVANPAAENSAVKKLQTISDNVSEDGSVPLKSLTELDRYFNSLPKSAYTDSPINGVARSATKSAIEKAAEAYPEFGEAHNAANGFFTNYKNEFENGAISNVWNPDDTKNLSMFANGKTRMVNPETQQRAEDFMANVKNGGLTTYNHVKSLLPDAASQQAFENEFKNYIIKTDGNGRWNAIKTLISDPFNNTGRKIFDVAKPQYNPETKAFLSGKSPVNYGGETAPFSSYMDDSAYNLNDMKQRQMDAEYEAHGETENQATAAPKLLTYQPHVMTANTYGQTLPMNPAIRQALGQSPSTIAERTPADILRSQQAAEQGQSDLLRQYGTRRLSEASELPPPKTSPTPPGALGNAAKLREAGFKRGGAVKPSPAQIEAGNYKKTHIRFQGLPISIENPKGSIRSGKDKNGKEWHCKMPCAYGYIRQTEAKDGEHIDCFIGPNPKSLRVYVIDQKHHDSGKFDEHKCMIGFKDREAAIEAYKNAFSDKKNRIMKVTKMLMPQFKEWLEKGDTKKPLDMVG